MANRITRRDVTRGLVTSAGLAATGPVIAALVPTPRQVEGPFHPAEAQDDTDLDLTIIQGHDETATGEVILVEGQVLGTDGQPLTNALVDVWQANHHGRYSHARDPNTAPLDPHFQGWGLLRTDSDGRYRFKTIKPGAYPLSFLGGDGWRCRHIHFKVIGDGHDELVTQMYFDGDPLLAQDMEIAKVPDEHKHLLIAKATKDDASGLPRYRFDVALQLA